MSAPSSTTVPPSAPIDEPEPEIRRLTVIVARFAAGLGLVALAFWWVVPPHSFSGPVLYVIDGSNGHGLHMGDLPAVLFLVAAFWLTWPVRQGRPAHDRTADAIRVAAVGALGGLSLWWIVPEHRWNGPTLLTFAGRRHGMHLLDPVVVVFLGAAVVLGWRWWRPVGAGLLLALSVWWAKGSHSAFSGPVIVRFHGHVLQRSDPIALVYLAAAAVIGVPWARQRWARWRRERDETRATRGPTGSGVRRLA